MNELVSVLVGGLVTVVTQLAKRYKVNSLFVVATLSVVAGLGYALLQDSIYFDTMIKNFSEVSSHGMAYSVLFYNVAKQFVKEKK